MKVTIQVLILKIVGNRHCLFPTNLHPLTTFKTGIILEIGFDILFTGKVYGDIHDVDSISRGNLFQGRRRNHHPKPLAR